MDDKCYVAEDIGKDGDDGWYVIKNGVTSGKLTHEILSLEETKEEALEFAKKHVEEYKSLDVIYIQWKYFVESMKYRKQEGLEDNDEQ